MVKVRVLSKCEHCKGEAYLKVGEDVDYKGNAYIRHAPCPVCEGSGISAKWIDIPKLLQLLEEAQCKHEHVTSQGGFHLTEGVVWDDVKEICDDCGVKV